MKYKNLGKTGTLVPVIGQGMMGIGGYLKRDTRNDEAQIEAIRLGIELGMTLIDTAEAYGEGHSEELVGRAIKGMREKAFIATKFSPEHHRHDDVLKAAEASLHRLGTDYIDLYQLHWPNPKIPISDTMRALKKLRQEGKIRYAGVGNLSRKELQEAEVAMTPDALVSLQIEYNLFDRSIEEAILPYCRSRGITVIAYSPLDHGKAARGESAGVLRKIAGKHHKTVSQVTLNWLVSHDSVTAIPKATNPEHIRQNAATTDFTLSAEELAEIDRTFNRPPVYVPTERIRVVSGGEGDRTAYRTLEEAMENKLGFVPSPAELAEDIKNGEPPKPVRVRRTADTSGSYDYDLVEGRVRYWAWVIAYRGEKPIPVLIREN